MGSVLHTGSAKPTQTRTLYYIYIQVVIRNTNIAKKIPSRFRAISWEMGCRKESNEPNILDESLLIFRKYNKRNYNGCWIISEKTTICPILLRIGWNKWILFKCSCASPPIKKQKTFNKSESEYLKYSNTLRWTLIASQKAGDTKRESSQIIIRNMDKLKTANKAR